MPRKSLEDWFWQISGDVIVVGTSGTLGMKANGRNFWEPKVDIYEDQHHFILVLELAGISPDELQVAYLPDRHSLLVRGVRHDEDLPGTRKKAIHQLEIYYGEFDREIALPGVHIDPEGMKAHYRAGLLYILVPKVRLRVQYSQTTIFKA